jgi:hypothetical protein
MTVESQEVKTLFKIVVKLVGGKWVPSIVLADPKQPLTPKMLEQAIRALRVKYKAETRTMRTFSRSAPVAAKI